MASVTSNIAQVELALGELGNILDLSRDGVGEDIAGIVAEGISGRSLNEQADPDGKAWADNKEPYKSSARKAGKPIGVLSGEMLSLEHIKGEREIRPTEMTMRYGRSGPVRDRAGWFTEGKGSTQEARPFYGLDGEIVREVLEYVDERAQARLREMG